MISVWDWGKARSTLSAGLQLRVPMNSSRSNIPNPPPVELLKVEDRSPPEQVGFLRIVRYRYRVRYPDGSFSEEFDYDAVDRNGIDAVVIAAHFLSDGRRHVYLRSAVRPPISLRDPALHPELPPNPNGTLWELPAGIVEPTERGESGTRQTAVRELKEEVGFDVPPEAMHKLGSSTYPAPGFIAERHFYYEVEVDPATRGAPELDGSPLERGGVVITLPLDDALECCKNGVIEDAKTELALRRLHERLS